MAFADVNDVKVRLQEAALSAENSAAATALCATATAVVCEAVDRPNEDWFNSLSTTRKNLVKGITVELVCRAMASPQGLTSATESLGAHSRTEQYRRDQSTALILTQAEERLIRDTVYGSTSGSASVESAIDRFIDLAEGQEIDHPGS